MDAVGRRPAGHLKVIEPPLDLRGEDPVPRGTEPAADSGEPTWPPARTLSAIAFALVTHR